MARLLAYTKAGVRLFIRDKGGDHVYPQLWTSGGASTTKSEPLPPVLSFFKSSKVRMSSGNKETPHNKRWVINVGGIKPTCAFLTRDYKQDTVSVAKALMSAICQRDLEDPIITYNGGGSNVAAGTTATNLATMTKDDGAVEIPWVSESAPDQACDAIVEECDDDGHPTQSKPKRRTCRSIHDLALNGKPIALFVDKMLADDCKEIIFQICSQREDSEKAADKDRVTKFFDNWDGRTGDKADLDVSENVVFLGYYFASKTSAVNPIGLDSTSPQMLSGEEDGQYGTFSTSLTLRSNYFHSPTFESTEKWFKCRRRVNSNRTRYRSQTGS
jgi:hypothetical protein